jgi:hypothetical protein
MRFVNANGRAGLLVGEQVFDAEVASGGAIPSDPQSAVTERWDDLLALAAAGATKEVCRWRRSVSVRRCRRHR